MEKSNLNNHLDTTAWRLYDLIKYNSVVENRKTTQKEICDKLNELGFVWNDEITTHDHCPKVWTVVNQINNSWEVDKVIISKNFEYWLGNEEETQNFLDSLWQQLSPRLCRYWNFKQKLSRNGQGKLISNQGEVITDTSKARRFVESYLENEVEENGEEEK